MTEVSVDELNIDPNTVRDYQWNIWEAKADGTFTRWVGSIQNPDVARAWIKKFGKSSVPRYRINNVPPHAVPSLYPDQFERERQKREAARPKRTEKKPAGRRVTPKPDARRSFATVGKPQAARKKTKDEREMEARAAELLKKHKADEAAEMEGKEK